jgi:hypothetical protein
LYKCAINPITNPNPTYICETKNTVCGHELHLDDIRIPLRAWEMKQQIHDYWEERDWYTDPSKGKSIKQNTGKVHAYKGTDKIKVRLCQGTSHPVGNING